MKKGIIAVLFAALAFSVAGCASSPAVEGPSWLNDFPPEDVLWGIGAAKQSSTDMSMQTAEARARVSIARQVDARVQSMFTDYNLDAGQTGAQANASMQENVSRTITNMNVSGARPIKREMTPDGTWWFLVEYRKSDAKNTVASIINNESAAFAQFKAEQALGILDQKLAENGKAMVVSE